jgi:hypothetical protein
MKSGLFIGVVLALILVGGWIFLIGDSDIEGDNESGDFDEPIEIGDPIQPDDIEEIGNAVPEIGMRQEATLLAVGDYSGSGVAVSTYIDGVYSHTVSAELGDPAEGKFYEGWLAGGFGFISTGKLEKEGDKYVLEFTSNDDLTSKYSKVVITEETEANGLDNKPEAHVIEGAWK